MVFIVISGHRIPPVPTGDFTARADRAWLPFLAADLCMIPDSDLSDDVHSIYQWAQKKRASILQIPHLRIIRYSRDRYYHFTILLIVY